MSRCFIIAEAGVNHNGDDDLALRLVDIAADAGADAVKFQTFRAEKLVQEGAATAEYQVRQTGETDQFALLKRLEMSQELHHRLIARCAARGIEFMSTPFDPEAADFLVGLGMSRIKIPSGELTNLPFLAHLASLGRPLILSTGMGDMAEVEAAVAVIRAAVERTTPTAPLADRLSILHCTSNYPAAAEDVNLLAMRSIADRTGLPVGYSDHTSGGAVSIAAVALGASTIEKHFTLDRNLPGPDHKASLEPAELAMMIADIRNVERAFGDGIKRPRPAELPVRALVRRSLASRTNLPVGHRLQECDITFLRPAYGLPPAVFERVLGQPLKRAVQAAQVLTLDDVEPKTDVSGAT